jgi:hypothetical protein
MCLFFWHPRAHFAQIRNHIHSRHFNIEQNDVGLNILKLLQCVDTMRFAVKRLQTLSRVSMRTEPILRTVKESSTTITSGTVRFSTGTFPLGNLSHRTYFLQCPQLEMACETRRFCNSAAAPVADPELHELDHRLAAANGEHAFQQRW